MPELQLGQTKSSSPLPRILIVVLVLIVGAGIYVSRQMKHITHAAVTEAELFPIHVQFENFTHELKHATEDDIYVLAKLHIQNDNTVPLFIKTYKATLIDANGEQRTSEAMSPKDIAAVQTMYPKIKPMISAPLTVETTIAPGTTADGLVVLQFPITKDDWAKRKSATLTVGFYHQDPITLTIP